MRDGASGLEPRLRSGDPWHGGAESYAQLYWSRPVLHSLDLSFVVGRRLAILAAFLLAGAVVNVAVAWACCTWSTGSRDDSPNTSLTSAEVAWILSHGEAPAIVRFSEEILPDNLVGGLLFAVAFGGVMLGTALVLMGVAYYAVAKDRSPAWCLMLFLWLPGLVVLALLKDKARPASAGSVLTDAGNTT